MNLRDILSRAFRVAPQEFPGLLIDVSQIVAICNRYSTVKEVEQVYLSVLFLPGQQVIDLLLQSK